MTPKLAELIAHCKAHGIEGSYSAKQDGDRWRARLKVGMTIYNVPDATRDEALERAATSALRDIHDPMPQPGTRAYVEWWARHGG